MGESGQPMPDEAALYSATRPNVTNADDEAKRERTPGVPLEDGSMPLITLDDLPDDPAKFDARIADTLPPRQFYFENDGVPFFPQRGLTLLTGLAKQGKTQFANILVGLTLAPDGFNFGTLTCRQRPSQILWIDTEQDMEDVRDNQRRCAHIAGVSLDEFDKRVPTFCMRPVNWEEKRRYLYHYIEQVQPDFLVLDGVRDIMQDFNDIKESLATWDILRSITDSGIAVLTMIHTNDAKSDKIRGHLGTELQNKMSDRINVHVEPGGALLQEVTWEPTADFPSVPKKYFCAEHSSRRRVWDSPVNYAFTDRGTLAAL